MVFFLGLGGWAGFGDKLARKECLLWYVRLDCVELEKRN